MGGLVVLATYLARRGLACQPATRSTPPASEACQPATWSTPPANETGQVATWPARPPIHQPMHARVWPGLGARTKRLGMASQVCLTVLTYLEKERTLLERPAADLTYCSPTPPAVAR